jgi:hypothetical protein
MKKLSVVAIALSTLVAGHAFAADAFVGKTREQVRAELIQAQRNGDLIADGETGARYKDLAPHLYAQPVAVSKSRAEVKAELAEAIRTGDIVADGQTGAKANELFPAQYAQARADKAVTATAAVGKTRAEVKAELAEALRTGDYVADGQTGAKANELFPGKYAQPVLAEGKTRAEVRAELVESRRANGG